MKLKLAICLLALGGCATEPDIVAEPFITPDGREAHIIYCGGFNSSMAECYDDARKVCSGDYTLIRESVTERDVRGLGSTENRSIQISCAA